MQNLILIFIFLETTAIKFDININIYSTSPDANWLMRSFLPLDSVILVTALLSTKYKGDSERVGTR